MHFIRSLVAFVLLTILGTFSANALTDQIRLTFADGRTVVIDLRESNGHFTTMLATPEGLIFHVPAEVEGEAATTYTFSVDELKSMNSLELTESEQTTGITAVAAPADNIAITPLDANTIRITGSDIRSAADIRVYDIAGTVVAAEITGSDSEYTLSLATLAPGVYIINAANTTLKVTKR